MENLSLSGDEGDELIIGDEGDEDQYGFSELCLVGKFLTDQSLEFKFIRSRLASIWKPQRGVSIKEIRNGRLLIQFFHKIDLKRVLEGGPWSIGSHPLLVHHLQIGEIPDQVPLNSLPFWVHVYNLPIGSFSEAVGKSLGNYIGRFLEYDASNKGAAWKTYMRIRVELDVSQPLKRGKKIRVGNGVSTLVSFKYERLSIFCFICGKLGHTENFCEVLFDAKEEIANKGWGVFLKAPDRRTKAMIRDKWLREPGQAYGGFSGRVSSTGNGEDSDGEGSSWSGKDTVAPDSGGFCGNIGTNLGVVTRYSEKFKEIQIMDNSASLRINPCFECGSNREEGEIDETALIELKKRKRNKHAHAGNDNHASSPDDEEIQANNSQIEVISQHFLSAGPGNGACREQ